MPIPRPALLPALAVGAALAATATYWQPGIIVVDGDTVRHGVSTYRLIGLDAPEIHRAKCAAERQLAERAADRLRSLTGGQTAVLIPTGHRDKYGRWLAKLEAGGVDVGTVLIAEGLARPYEGRSKREGWCPLTANPR